MRLLKIPPDFTENHRISPENRFNRFKQIQSPHTHAYII